MTGFAASPARLNGPCRGWPARGAVDSTAAYAVRKFKLDLHERHRPGAGDTPESIAGVAIAAKILRDHA